VSESICVVGLGLMGRPIARRLIGVGFEVRGWNRSPLAPDLTDGIALAGDLDAATAADVLLLALADSAATGAVLGALDPRIRPGTLVIDAGSSDPADSRERAARLGQRGAGWVDAPVSGGPGGAARGSLAIMAGALEGDFERARPVLAALGANVAHVGGPGAGHAMKVVNQVIVGLAIEAVAEALALAGAMGFEVGEVQAALRGGSADNPQLRAVGNRIARRDYTPGAKIRTILKDLRMAGGLAESLGLDLPHLRRAQQVCERIVSLGAAEQDCAIVYELLAADGRLRAAPGAPSQGGATTLREELR
jgi:3-hydroxyisobutyrate dehydrogenase-like beta-hydroxyacid dehydrogenase